MKQEFTSIANPGKILDSFEKGKRASVGEIRTWANGQKMQKTNDGWKPVANNGSVKKKGGDEKLEFAKLENAIAAWQEQRKEKFVPDPKKSKYANDREKEKFDLYLLPSKIGKKEVEIYTILKEFSPEKRSAIKEKYLKMREDALRSYNGKKTDPFYKIVMTLPKDEADNFTLASMILRNID